jgi:fucose 4-O-acetylase-like acetyltransferase
MFDALKGVGMLAIIFSHTLDLYASAAGGAVPALLFSVFSDMLMSAFFIMSGYGFRKRPMGKCIQQQLRSAVRPFLYTALATAVLHFVMHYTMFHDRTAAFTETLRVLGGFALGLPHTATYGGVTIFSCGPMWYMLALVVGWIVLNLIMNLFPERMVKPAVCASALLGWLCCTLWELPYCISQGLIVAFYLYIGYQAKKQKSFEKPLPWWYNSLFLLCIVLTLAGALLRGFADNLSSGQWTIGPLSIAMNGLLAFGVTRFFARLNWPQNFAVRGLERIGRFSLQFFCLHTVELIAVPWYLFAARFVDHPMQGLFLQYGLRLCFIGAVCTLLVNRGSILRALQPRRTPKPKHSPMH